MTVFRVYLKGLAADSSETFVPSYQTARSHILEDRNLHIYSRKNFRSHISDYFTKENIFLYNSKLQNISVGNKSVVLTTSNHFSLF